jgi:M6 family metalloprotease-like protein
MLPPTALKASVFIALFALATAAISAPANPTVMEVEQVGGGSFNAQSQGDEYQGWIETTDGRTIVANAANGGRLEYAQLDLRGDLVPSGIAVPVANRGWFNSVLKYFSFTAPSPPGPLPPPGLHPRRNTELEQEQDQWIESLRRANAAIDLRAEAAPAIPSVNSVTGTWAPKQVTGPKKLLVVLVNFSNAKLTEPPDYWSKIVFGNGSSVASYYSDNSYGRVTISPVSHTQAGSPQGILTISLNEASPNYWNAINCVSKDAPWVNRALAAASSFVNFPALDANSDGKITVDEALIYFVLAGYEAAAGSGQSPAVWAHRCGAVVSVSGKKIDNFALSGELYNKGVPMAMGVIAHEMGHAMGGLPDLYDISNTNAGLGAFSLMSFGAWGARQSEIPATTPVGLDAWSRQYLGWSSPRSPLNGNSLDFPSGLTDATSAVMLMNPGASTSEYWLVENRPPLKWDEGLFHLIGVWKGGLLIQHIDANVGTAVANSFNQFVAGNHQGNIIVRPPSAGCDLSKSPKAPSCPTLLFYAGNSIAYDDGTTPPAHYYTGNASRVGIERISAPGDTITATLTVPP